MRNDINHATCVCIICTTDKETIEHIVDDYYYERWIFVFSFVSFSWIFHYLFNKVTDAIFLSASVSHAAYKERKK